MHFYQFHIGDYASHTRHLSLIEDLAYRRLLDFYYLHEVPIRQREIARQIGMRDHEQEVLSILEEFFVSTESGYINPRADREIAAYKELKEAGKRGAEKRWGQAKSSTYDSPPIASPLPPHWDANATPIATINHKPLTNNQKNTARKLASPEGVSSSVWESFLAVRKAKKAPMTQVALDGIVREAKKAGWSLEQALSECCTRGWQSFKADWVQTKADIARTTVPGRAERDPELVKIELAQTQKAAPPPEIMDLVRRIKR